MTLNIDDTETGRLARELASSTGEPLTTAVTVALRERLERVRATECDALRTISDRAAGLPLVDDRSDEEILGYDERGLPA